MLSSLQMLRALAALLVVVVHITAHGQTPTYWNGLGAIGVDIFFVISGVVMVIASEGKRRTFSEFMRDRLTRIAPLYWLALTLFMAVILTDQVNRIIPSASEIIRAYLFIPYTDSRSGDPVPFLGPGWTLSCELLFYALFGASVALGRWKQVGFLFVVFAVLVGLRPVLGDIGALGMRLSSPIMFEFLFGVILGRVLVSGWTPPFFVGATILAAAALVIVGESFGPWSKLPRVIGFGVPAAMIVTGVVLLEPLLQDRRWTAPIVFLGNASFSLYLSHPFTIEFSRRLGIVETASNSIVLIVACVAIGCATFVLVERPLLSLSRKAWPQRRLAEAAA